MGLLHRAGDLKDVGFVGMDVAHSGLNFRVAGELLQGLYLLRVPASLCQECVPEGMEPSIGMKMASPHDVPMLGGQCIHG